jgi:hypothetical protein
MLTLFSTCKPFEGYTGIIQKNAVRSWSNLRPKPEIILIGDDAGTSEMVFEVGGLFVPHVARALPLKLPFVNAIFVWGEAYASHNVLGYINSDIILPSHFMQVVQEVDSNWDQFLIIGQRTDKFIRSEIDFSDPDWEQSLVQVEGKLHSPAGVDYFIYRRGVYTLKEIPDFIMARTSFDNWLVKYVLDKEIPVLDATDIMEVVHQIHSTPDRESESYIRAFRHNRGYIGPGEVRTIEDATYKLRMEHGEGIQS